ncbi:unnamed protein product [Closterium sp. Naga37s-1]|nr:unnamed protein product [Closterium sp. Naga37s-1]
MALPPYPLPPHLLSPYLLPPRLLLPCLLPSWLGLIRHQRHMALPPGEAGTNGTWLCHPVKLAPFLLPPYPLSPYGLFLLSTSLQPSWLDMCEDSSGTSGTWLCHHTCLHCTRYNHTYRHPAASTPPAAIVVGNVRALIRHQRHVALPRSHQAPAARGSATIPALTMPASTVPTSTVPTFTPPAAIVVGNVRRLIRHQRHVALPTIEAACQQHRVAVAPILHLHLMRERGGVTGGGG